MRKPGGYLVTTGPDGTQERDTFTCAHCQKVVLAKPSSDPADAGGLCRVCGGLVCGPCVSRGSCVPWEARMEVAEARDRFRREAGLT
ncbi:hypothetical protein CMI37_11435 [Candidatus Pacearchaeota archaeon]|nr:hypothetical protein [Candidatus Pacearchaeota archaeon]